MFKVSDVKLPRTYIPNKRKKIVGKDTVSNLMGNHHRKYVGRQGRGRGERGISKESHASEGRICGNKVKTNERSLREIPKEYFV